MQFADPFLQFFVQLQVTLRGNSFDPLEKQNIPNWAAVNTGVGKLRLSCQPLLLNRIILFFLSPLLLNQIILFFLSQMGFKHSSVWKPGCSWTEHAVCHPAPFPKDSSLEEHLLVTSSAVQTLLLFQKPFRKI